MTNNLWYWSQPISKIKPTSSINEGIARAMNRTVTYELWHHILWHLEERKMRKLHKMIDGLLKKNPRNPFYQCHHCIPQQANTRLWKDTKMHQLLLHLGHISIWIFSLSKDQTSKQKTRMEKRFTSIDGYNSYILIVDKITRYHWVFLTKT